MIKYFAIVIAILIFGTSCTTMAVRDLNTATRACADTSFAFDVAVREYDLAVAAFRSSVIELEAATRSLANLISDENGPERMTVLHANLRALNARIRNIEAEQALWDASFIATQAHDDSIRADIEFRQAEHALLVSPDPWGSNMSVRSRAISARNISVRIHNNAVERLDSLRSSVLVILEASDEAIESFTNIHEQFSERFSISD